MILIKRDEMFQHIPFARAIYEGISLELFNSFRITDVQDTAWIIEDEIQEKMNATDYGFRE